MRAAACAAVICATALAAGCGGSERPNGFAHPRVLEGSIEQPDPQRLALQQGASVDFVSDDLGYLTTAGGAILRTDDGGLTWTRTGGRLPHLVDIDFVTPSRGFALTERGVLLTTDDGARSWHRVVRFPAGGHGQTDSTVQFLNPERGWAVPLGGPVYRTQDRGRSWARLSQPCGEFETLVGPSFFDWERGYAVCAGQPSAGSQLKRFYATENGGATWELRSRDWALGGYARELIVHGAERGLFVTERGGLSAFDAVGSERVLLPTDDEDSISDVAWPSSRRIYAVTFHAGLLRSDDGGSHWRRLYGGNAPPPTGPIAFASGSQGTGFSAETITGGAKAVFATADGGRSWTPVAVGHPKPLADQVFRFGATILAANGRGVTRSDDAGRSWRRVSSRSGWFDFLSPEVGYRAEGKSLSRTADGGVTWTPAARTDVDLQGVVFMTRNDAFVIDYGDPPPDPGDGKKHVSALVDQLEESHDGGEHWQPVVAPLMGSVLAMYRLDDEHWWLLAGVFCSRVAHTCASQIWRTSDGGRHWDLIRLPREFYGSSFSFVSPQVGFVKAGAGGGLYRTADGGVSWSYVYPR